MPPAKCIVDAAGAVRCVMKVSSAMLTVGMLVAASGGLAAAEPGSGDGAAGPYPELRYFTKTSAEPYVIPGQGIWFATPLGLNCGIWLRGSFGCDGDIPGAPPGVGRIGWITGDARVHYDWTLAVRYRPARGVLTLPPLSYVESEGTSCATTVDGGTYCERGPWRMLISSIGTWLNGAQLS